MKIKNRFDSFNPDEREILRLLLEYHLNLVSEIGHQRIKDNNRMLEYLLVLEKLEDEAKGI